MALRKRIKIKKISADVARRYYVRHFTGLPRELSGTEMEKEHFLNAFSVGNLDVVGVQPKRA